MKETKIMPYFNPTIDVIYLARGIDWNIKTVKNFFESYKKYSAGYEHNLIIAAKAWEDKPDEYNELENVAKEVNAKIINLPDDGFDFGAYYRVAKISKSNFIFSISTSSEIQCDNWLHKFIEPINKNKNYQLVGSYGAWEICPTKYNYLKMNLDKQYEHTNKHIKISYGFKKLKIFFQTIKEQIGKQKYPNYSVRSNCYLMDRELYIDFIEKGHKGNLPKDKFDAYKMENGPKGMSNFVIKQDYDFCVVGKNGEIYTKEKFKNSGTYRSKFKNYIIKDKQIRNYEDADAPMQKLLEKICWGDNDAK